MENEARIFKRMQEGDWAAFELFFKEHTKQLYLYAIAFVKEKAVAEDIVQDVFVWFWTNRSKIRYTGSVYAYLLLAVRNACINHKSHLQVEEKYRQAMMYAGEGEGGEDDWEGLRERVMAAVESLPPKCREIFILGAVEGLKYQEIAERLDVSVNTVKTQMKYAYRKVKAQTGAGQDLIIAIVLLHSGIV